MAVKEKRVEEEHDPLFFKKEIRILQFWRSQLAPGEFARYDPDDLVRWHMALSLVGAVDIRALLTERPGNRPRPLLQGVVAAAPHPPVKLVEQWLESEETRVRTAPIWLGAVSFIVLSFVFGGIVSTCSLDTTVNPLVMHPQPTSPELPPTIIAVSPTVGDKGLTGGMPAPPTLPAFPTTGGAPPPALSPPSFPAPVPPLAHAAGQSSPR